jgi:hypothetical protein
MNKLKAIIKELNTITEEIIHPIPIKSVYVIYSMSIVLFFLYMSRVI